MSGRVLFFTFAHLNTPKKKIGLGTITRRIYLQPQNKKKHIQQNTRDINFRWRTKKKQQQQHSLNYKETLAYRHRTSTSNNNSIRMCILTNYIQSRLFFFLSILLWQQHSDELRIDGRNHCWNNILFYSRAVFFLVRSFRFQKIIAHSFLSYHNVYFSSSLHSFALSARLCFPLYLPLSASFCLTLFLQWVSWCVRRFPLDSASQAKA